MGVTRVDMVVGVEWVDMVVDKGERGVTWEWQEERGGVDNIT